MREKRVMAELQDRLTWEIFLRCLAHGGPLLYPLSDISNNPLYLFHTSNLHSVHVCAHTHMHFIILSITYS